MTHDHTSPLPGGYFIGTIPMGPRVEELLGKRPELRTPMLRLVRKWKVRQWDGGSGGRTAAVYALGAGGRGRGSGGGGNRSRGLG